jgi:hypothetical protein
MRTLAILLLLTTCASAATPSLWKPPVRFDHPFRGTVHILQKPFWVCPGAWACTPIPPAGTRVCTIYSNSIGFLGMDRAGYRNVIRHEIGHCNGWPQNHPR